VASGVTVVCGVGAARAVERRGKRAVVVVNFMLVIEMCVICSFW
jgi:hypothetical protein